MKQEGVPFGTKNRWLLKKAGPRLLSVFCLALVLITMSSCGWFGKKKSKDAGEAIDVTVAIPITPEQAAMLIGASQADSISRTDDISRTDELSRTDDITRTDELSRVDEGVRAVVMDVYIDDQLVAQGVRGGIRAGVRGGVRTGVRTGVRGGVRGSPRRQEDSEPGLVFEATIRLPKKMASEGAHQMKARPRAESNPNLAYIEVTTTVEVIPTEDGKSVQIVEKDILLNEVEMPDLDGDGVASLVEVMVAGVEAATDSESRPDEASVKSVMQALGAKLEQAIAAQGFQVKVDVTKVDLIPPETAVAFSSGTRSIMPADKELTFIFSCNETFCTYRCSLNDAPFAICSTPYTLKGLAESDYSLKVKASDIMGNADPTPAQIAFKIIPPIPPDTIPPETALSCSIPNETCYFGLATAQTLISFQFSCNEPDCSFICKLDGTTVINPCTSPSSFTQFTAGGHSFEAQAIDLAGNTDATPSRFKWFISEGAPVSNPSGVLASSGNFSSADGLSTSATVGTASTGVAKDDNFETRQGASNVEEFVYLKVK